MDDFNPEDDPHFLRESEKYVDPVPSREYILSVLEGRDYPTTLDELCDHFTLTNPRQRRALSRRLRAMERDCQVSCDRRDRYSVGGAQGLVRGVVELTESDRYFITNGAETVFLEREDCRAVFPGDHVVIKITGPRKGELEGELIEITERRHRVLVGRYDVCLDTGIVTPEEEFIQRDIIILPGEELNAQSGDMVKVKLLAYPTARTQGIGKIIKVLGKKFSADIAVAMAISEHQIRDDWSDQCIEASEALPKRVLKQDINGRKDLRDIPFVTIDGEDAKDFDDAVYCEPTKSGYTLYVAIADVSHYVKLDDTLDVEARERSNSTYFPNYVVPMLPEKLSNGLCSLKPKVDRLSMVCEMNVDKKGRVKEYSFYTAVIHSHGRLTYTQVAAVLEGDQATSALLADVVPHLLNLYALYNAFVNAREARGALEFDTVEPIFELDKSAKVKAITARRRNVAHQLIEECMLAANVSAADIILRSDLNGIYRVHDLPSHERLEGLKQFLTSHKISWPKKRGDVTAGQFMQILRAGEGKVDDMVLQMQVLRTMAQARYAPDEEGHFGLGFESYTHFTSPIRRYADLMVHRMIKQIVGETREQHFYNIGELHSLCDHISRKERVSDEASRHVQGWLKCAYIKNFIGETFDGVITSVNHFGFFVSLADTCVDGLVHLSALGNDYYLYEGATQTLVGERTGQIYRLGQSVRVRLTWVKIIERKVDLELADLPKKKKGVKKAGPAKKKGKKRAT